MRKLLIILLLITLPLTVVKAQSLPPYIIVTDDGNALPAISDEEIIDHGVAIHFRVNSSKIAPNDSGYHELINALRNIPPKYKFCRLLVLRGSSSPEGPVENNEWLAHRRARALTDSLRKYVTLPDSTVEERFINEDYTGLYELVKNSNFEYKDEVLSEIGNTDDDAVIKERLKAIDNGRAWHWLVKLFFPKLRATRVMMVVSPNPKEIAPAAPTPSSSLSNQESSYKTSKSQDQNISKDDSKQDTVAPSPLRTEGSGEVPIIAIKSNLLYDAALAPNIEIERWFGKDNRWSVMAEWNFPWWQWHHKERVYEINEIGLELRHWLFKKSQAATHKVLTGHFIGFYAAGGYYDLEWRYHGEQGDIYSAGFTYGYAISLSRHWNMEFSASLGYLHSPYTHYEAEHHDDILFAKYKKNLNYFGPTKLKISIVWLIGKTKRH